FVLEAIDVANRSAGLPEGVLRGYGARIVRELPAGRHTRRNLRGPAEDIAAPRSGLPESPRGRVYRSVVGSHVRHGARGVLPAARPPHASQFTVHPEADSG